MSERHSTLPNVGDHIDGRFRIDEILGSGGFGTVYRATQEAIGRSVALKFLSPTLVKDTKSVERFRREAFHISQLRHPNTVTLYDYGQTEEGFVYMVLEYLQGLPLSKILAAEGALPVCRVAYIFSQILKSLTEAHRLGIVHRDIKPENILLCEMFGEPDYVKVLDFGVAKMTSTQKEDDLTQQGTVFGTPMYMAPEQAYGDKVTPATDVYALGLTLFEMLTGLEPVTGQNRMEVLERQIHDVVPVLPPTLVGTPFGLIIRRATEKDPKVRYANAGELLKDFNRAINELSIVPIPSSSVFPSLESISHPEEYYSSSSELSFGEMPSSPPCIEEDAPTKHQLDCNFFDLTADENGVTHRALDLDSSGVSFFPDEPFPSENSEDFLVDTTIPAIDTLQARIDAKVSEEIASSLDILDKQDLLSSFDKLEEVDPRDSFFETNPSQSHLLSEISHCSGELSCHRIGKDDCGGVEFKLPSHLLQRWRSRRLSDTKKLPPGDTIHPPYAGRDLELNQMVNKITTSVARSKSLCFVIEGESGIGKSRFIEEVSDRLDREKIDVCVTTCRSFAFSLNPVRDVFRSLWGLLHIEYEDLEEIIRNELHMTGMQSQLIDLIVDFFISTEEEFSEEILAKLFPLLISLLIEIARAQPLLLIFDDLELIDISTISFLEKLTKELFYVKKVPLLVGVTLRLHDTNHPHSEFELSIRSLKEHQASTFFVFKLKPLPTKVVQQILDSYRPLDDDLRDRITWLSQGIVLYALQIVEYLNFTKRLAHRNDGRWYLRNGTARDIELPPDLLDLMQMRIEQAIRNRPIPSDIIPVIQWLAILGYRIPYAIIVDPCGYQIDAELNYLEKHGLIRYKESNGIKYIEFVTALLRQVVLLDLQKRTYFKMLSERAADAKYQFYVKSKLQTPYIEIAEHWRNAGLYDQYILYLKISADRAKRVGDLRGARRQYNELLRSYERLLPGEKSLEESVYVHYALAEIAWNQGEYGAAEEQFSLAVQAGRLLSNPDVDVDLASGLRGIGHILILRGNIERARQLYQEAYLSSEKAKDPEGIAKALIGLSRTYLAQSDLLGEREFSRCLLKQIKQIENPSVLHGKVAYHLANVSIYQDNTEGEEYYLELALHSFEASQYALGILDVLIKQVIVYSSSICNNPQRLQVAAIAIARIDEINREVRDRYRLFETYRAKGHYYMLLGNLKKAKEQFDHAKKYYQTAGVPYNVGLCRLALGQLANLMEHYDVAEIELQQAALVFVQMKDQFLSVKTMIFLSDTYLSLGKFDRAKVVLDKSQSIITHLGTTQFVAQIQFRLAFLDCCFRDFEMAKRRLFTLLPGTVDLYVPDAISALAGSLLSIIHLLEGDLNQAFLYAEQSVEIAEKHNEPRTLSFVHGNAGFVARVCERHEPASEWSESHRGATHYFYYSRHTWLRWLQQLVIMSIPQTPPEHAKRLLNAMAELWSYFGERHLAEMLIQTYSPLDKSKS